LTGLSEAVASLTHTAAHPRNSEEAHGRVSRLWSEALLSLAARTEEEDHATRPELTDDGPGARDHQPRGRTPRSRHRRTDPRPPARAAARADATTLVAR